MAQYNYYYARMSQGFFDPQVDPTYYKNLVGCTYLVYFDRDGSPMSSLREKQMRDAMNDYRALMLLDSLVGKERVLSICEGVLGAPIDIYTLPADGAQMIELRNTVNLEIRKALNI